MWVRLQLDFNWWDFAFGMSSLMRPHNHQKLKQVIGKHWSPAIAFPVLSVRSGFDLFLRVMNWPAGSEIVCSALNIPDMSMVARQHGIVPVPADLELETLAPTIDSIERAITPRTRAILIAHLYGNTVDLAPIVSLARKHGLMLIEDCAENYDGVYVGHPHATVSFFSFGPLKTATSLAGGVVSTRDAELGARLEAAHAQWPLQARRDCLNRLSKYGTMKFFGARWIYGATRKAARLVVGDVDKLIHHTAKSFRDDEIMVRLRQRPCGPLLASMARRLARFDHRRLAQRTANGQLLTSLLRGHVVCPGADVEPHNYWLFPVLMTDPPKAVAALEEAGFDGTQIQSMRAIDAPSDRPELEPVRAKEALEHMVLVPCYPGIPESELRRLADVLIRVERESSLTEALKVTLQPEETRYDRPHIFRPEYAETADAKRQGVG